MRIQYQNRYRSVTYFPEKSLIWLYTFEETIHMAHLLVYKIYPYLPHLKFEVWPDSTILYKNIYMAFSEVQTQISHNIWNSIWIRLQFWKNDPYDVALCVCYYLCLPMYVYPPVRCLTVHASVHQDTMCHIVPQPTRVCVWVWGFVKMCGRVGKPAFVRARACERTSALLQFIFCDLSNPVMLTTCVRKY